MKHLLRSSLLVCILTSLAACTAVPQSAAEPASGQDEPTPAPDDNAPAAPAPTCEAVTIFYEENAQFELNSSQGQRILLDASRPRALSAPPTEKDILLTTHTQHNDHFSADFSDAFPGQQLKAQVGKIELPGVTIEGIASSHSASGELLPEKGSNYIFIVDVDGIRIVHFGSIGQEALTPEQLEALGEVDIALMQLDNTFSDMTIKNHKAFDLMAQVQPRLIISTHIVAPAAEVAVQKWPGLYTDQPSIRLCKSDLPAETQILMMGQFATTYHSVLNLTRVDW